MYSDKKPASDKGRKNSKNKCVGNYYVVKGYTSDLYYTDFGRITSFNEATSIFWEVLSEYDWVEIVKYSDGMPDYQFEYFGEKNAPINGEHLQRLGYSFDTIMTLVLEDKYNIAKGIMHSYVYISEEDSTSDNGYSSKFFIL